MCSVSRAIRAARNPRRVGKTNVGGNGTQLPAGYK
nr:MAG TPA: hypothetical protein [Caudoviricetes sp.]